MDSYNFINGVHASQNKHINLDILKGEWGFQGILVSDWVSTYDAVGAANGGLDLEMPSGKFFNRQNLLPAVQQGSVSVATIDDKVRRILRTAIQFGWLDRDQTDLSISRYNREGDQVTLDAAREGAVLLKNDGNLLPLQKGAVKSILVIGPNAYPAVSEGGGSARAIPFEAVSLLQGISDYLGTGVHVLYHLGVPRIDEIAANTFFSTSSANGRPKLKAEYFENEDLHGKPFLTREEDHVNVGAPSRSVFPENSGSIRWTGYYTPAAAGQYDFMVASSGEDGGFYRVYVDEKPILDDWRESRDILGVATLSLDSRAHKVVIEHHGHSHWLGARMKVGIISQSAYVPSDAKALAAKADVVVVAAGFDPGSESEGADRTFRLPPGQDQLIQEMLAANKNTVVVLNSGGGVDMNA
jgi:beta-glucosidase